MPSTDDDRLTRTDVIHRPDFRVELIQGPAEAHNGAVVFSFGQRVKGELDGLGFGGPFLLSLGFDVVAIKSDRFDWYANISAADIFLINRKISQNNYNKFIGYGSSMGGHAAVKFSNLFKFDTVMAFSPLFDIRFNWDTRWAADTSSVAHLKTPMITSNNIRNECRYFFSYDPYDLDAKHIAFFRSLIDDRNLHTLITPFSGHAPSFFLHDIGMLKQLTHAVLLDNRWPDLTRGWRSGRVISPAYLFWCAQKCLDHHHYHWALALVQRLLPLQPENAEAHMLHCKILNELGQRPAARAALDKALAFDHPNHVHYRGYEAEHFRDEGQQRTAQREMKGAIDFFSDRKVAGWIQCDGGEEVEVSIRLDGETVLARLERNARGDRTTFVLEVPRELTINELLATGVEARLAGTSFRLEPWSPLVAAASLAQMDAMMIDRMLRALPAPQRDMISESFARLTHARGEH